VIKTLMQVHAYQAKLAYLANSGAFPKISCFALRGSQHARSYVKIRSRAKGIDLPSSCSLCDPPSSWFRLIVVNRQGGVVDKSINGINATINSLANTIVICIRDKLS
jgi:hypothetical protein